MRTEKENVSEIRSFAEWSWDDIRLLLACADFESFAGAAQAVGLDQSTVSRRVGELEAAIGGPLFHRKRSGATPTAAGLFILARARSMANAAAQVEEAMRGLADFAAPTVSIGASEGLMAYSIKPALLGQARAELPFDRRGLERPLPALAFSTVTDGADIAIETTNPGEVPRKQGNFRVQKIGAMRFVPVVARACRDGRSAPSRFDEIAGRPLLDIRIYKRIGGLEPWNGLVAHAEPTMVTTIEKTSQIRDPMLAGAGITVLAPYSKFHDSRIHVLDMAVPDMSVSLWLTAHEDALREPAVRMTYNLLRTMFRASPWFR